MSKKKSIFKKEKREYLVRKGVLALLACFLTLLLIPAISTAQITCPITNNSYDDYGPQINNNGYVVWYGWDGTDYEIFLYNGTTTTQLTNNSYGDYFPQINDNGSVSHNLTTSKHFRSSEQICNQSVTNSVVKFA